MPCKENECKCEATKTELIADGHDKYGNCRNPKCGHPVLNHTDVSATGWTPSALLRTEGPVQQDQDIAVPLSELESFRTLRELVHRKSCPLVSGPYQSGKTSHLHALEGAFKETHAFHYVSLASLRAEDNVFSYICNALEVTPSPSFTVLSSNLHKLDPAKDVLLCFDELDKLRQRQEWAELKDFVKTCTDTQASVVVVCAGTLLLYEGLLEKKADISAEPGTKKQKVENRELPSPWNATTVIEVSFFSQQQVRHLFQKAWPELAEEQRNRAVRLIYSRTQGHPSLTVWLLWRLVSSRFVHGGLKRFMKYLCGPGIVKEAMMWPSIKMGLLDRMVEQTVDALPLLLEFSKVDGISWNSIAIEQIPQLRLLRALGVIQERGDSFQFYAGLVRDAFLQMYATPRSIAGLQNIPRFGPDTLTDFIMCCLRLVDVRALSHEYVQKQRAVGEYQWQFECASAAKSLVPSGYSVTVETWTIDSSRKRLDMLISSGIVVAIEFASDLRTQAEVDAKLTQARGYLSSAAATIVVNFVPSGPGKFVQGGAGVILVLYDLANNCCEIQTERNSSQCSLGDLYRASA